MTNTNYFDAIKVKVEGTIHENNPALTKRERRGKGKEEQLVELVSALPSFLCPLC